MSAQTQTGLLQNISQSCTGQTQIQSTPAAA
jgi:hypothetical protein